MALAKPYLGEELGTRNDNQRFPAVAIEPQRVTEMC